VGQLALASSITEIGDDEGRTWCPRRKNNGCQGGSTVQLGAGVVRWSLQVKECRR